MTSYEMRNQVQELIRSLRPKLSDNSIKTYCTTMCALHRKLFGDTFSVENFIVQDKMSTVLKSLDLVNQVQEKLCTTHCMSARICQSTENL